MSRYHATCAIVAYIVWGVLMLSALVTSMPNWVDIAIFGLAIVLAILGANALGDLHKACQADDRARDASLSSTGQTVWLRADGGPWVCQ